MTKAFVHGNPETAAIWGPLVERLAAHGVDDVVLLSPPGFGAPMPADWDPTPGRYVDWLAAEIDAIDGPVDIVGHDWGAGHVYGLLAEQPTKVRSWAADCAGLLHPDYVWHDMAQVWQTPGAGEEAVQAMSELSDADRAAAYGSLGLPPEIASSMAAAVNAEMGHCVLGLYRGAVPPTLADLGRRVQATELPPGLIIDATADAYVSSDLAAAMVEPLGAGHLRLEGNGHWWMTEDPETAAAGLTSFWAGLGS